MRVPGSANPSAVQANVHPVMSTGKRHQNVGSPLHLPTNLTFIQIWAGRKSNYSILNSERQRPWKGYYSLSALNMCSETFTKIIDLFQQSFLPRTPSSTTSSTHLINWFSSITLSQISCHQDKDEHFDFTKSRKGYTVNLPKITQCATVGREHEDFWFLVNISHHHLRKYETLNPQVQRRNNCMAMCFKNAFNSTDWFTLISMTESQPLFHSLELLSPYKGWGGGSMCVHLLKAI